MRLLRLLGTGSRSGGPIVSSALVFSLFTTVPAAAQATRWEDPAARIAHRIAEVLGPASARLTVDNLSSITKDAVPAIRLKVEEDLKADGVSVTSADGANTIRLTLSEDAHGGLWVAEVVEGNQTRVVMTPVDLMPLPGPQTTQKVLLHRDVLAKASEMQWKSAQQEERPELLAAAEVNGDLVVLTAERVSVFEPSPMGWSEREHAEFGNTHGASRDPRGMIVPSSDSRGFTAYAAGVECAGVFDATAAPAQAGAWSLKCHGSDDPWPVVPMGDGAWTKAFFNSGRDYFTGVVTPALGTDLPPFYSTGFLPGRPGAAILIGGVDGRLQVVEGGQIEPVAGTRDMGSDFAVMTAGCGTGSQVVVSSSGEGMADSLRAYEIPAQEAVAVSGPLTLPGTAMALWPAPDGKSVLAIVRTALQREQRFDYEVDRVTETCN